MAKSKCDKYNNIPVSSRTKSGMTLTIDDLKFMKMLICNQDDYIEEMIEKRDQVLTNQLAQTLQEQLKSIHEQLKIIASDINDIRIDIGKINMRLDATDEKIVESERRIKALEKYASIENTAIRITLAVALSVIAGTILHALVF